MKTKINKEKKISTVLLGYHLSPDSINKLLEIAKVIFVKNRTNLVNIGDINQNVYFIIEGGFVARSFYFDSQKIAASNFFLNDYFPFMGCIDSFFTGVSEGIIGSDRLIEMLNVVDGQLVVEEKGIYSIEKFIVARRLMYWQVYFHKTSLVAELIFIYFKSRVLIQKINCF